MVTLDAPEEWGHCGNCPEEQPSEFGLVEFCADICGKKPIRQWYKRSRREENIARGRLVEKGRF